MYQQISDFSKHAHSEDEGLQVVQHDTYHDEQGLHPVPGYSGPPSPGGKEPYITAAAAAAPAGSFSKGAEPVTPQPDKRKRKWLILGGVSAFIIIVIVAVVGGVVGSRKGSSSNDAATASASPSSTSSAAAAGMPTNNRVASTRGVFNGTGIASIYAHHAGFWAFLFYQDYTGAIKAAQHTRPDDFSIAIHGTPQTVNIDAANGTALAAARYNESGSDHFHLIYVNKQNILSDAWMDSSALDNEGNYVNSTPWSAGTLSSCSFKVPTDDRVGMYIDTNDYWYGKEYNNTGARLVVGGDDGALHQFSFDWPSMTWAPDVYKFPKSYAYSGVQIRAAGDTGKIQNSTMYSMASDGSIQYWAQSSNHPNNDTQWPVGSTWADPVSVPVQAAQNSSLSVSYDSHNILFPLGSGSLGNIAVDQTAGASQFGKVGSGYGAISIMPGTDMTFDSLDGYQLTFSQNNGTNIQFLVFDLGAKLTKGGVII